VTEDTNLYKKFILCKNARKVICIAKIKDRLCF